MYLLTLGGYTTYTHKQSKIYADPNKFNTHTQEAIENQTTYQYHQSQQPSALSYYCGGAPSEVWIMYERRRCFLRRYESRARW